MMLARWLRPSAVAPVVLALAMVILILVPASEWHHPTYDGVYRGFDPNLVYIDARGNGDSSGIIESSNSSLILKALPASQPTVDLITSALGFEASMDLAILGSGGARPARLGIWSPSTSSGFFYDFGASPQNLLSADYVVGGIGSRTLIGGRAHPVEIGQYQLGQRYHVVFRLDKKRQILSSSISSPLGVPVPGRFLLAGDLASDYQDIRSPRITVVGGQQYLLGGWVSYVAGLQPYAIGVLWSDRHGNPLPFPNWWRPSTDLSGWTRRQLVVTAPKNAASATVFLGAGKASSYLFGDMYFKIANQPNLNLLPNGQFANGASGWKIINNPDRVPRIIDPQRISSSSEISALDSPDLFRAFRPSLAVTASADSGNSLVRIDNYIVKLPSQPESAAELIEKTDDSRAKVAIWALAVLGLLLGLVILFSRAYMHRRTALQFRSNVLQRNVLISSWLPGLAIIGVISYLVGNSFLFHLATPHFDVYAPKIWAYLASQHSFLDLYHRPLITPAAAVEAGVPLHEATFPYGPTKVYFYVLAGFINKWLLSPPGPVVADTFQAEVLIKLLNVLAALIDAWLIYGILRRMGLLRGRILSTVCVFVLNPAVLFVMSVWGSTETVSLLFILLAVWLFERQALTLAWLSLIAGAATRPQMFVVAFLLTVVFLRRSRFAKNIVALAWAVVWTFVGFSPLLIALGPSFPVDYIKHVLSFSVGTGQADAAYLGASPGYYSIWTIPMELVNHQHGLARMWYPKTATLFGSVTYAEASAVLSAVFVVLVGVLIAVSPGIRFRTRDYFPVVAFGMFGWLIFSTGLVSRYFIYGVVLIVLCRRSFRAHWYFGLIGLLTFIVLVTSWGHIALDLQGSLAASAPLYPANSPVTRLVLDLFSYDRFITAGALANLIVLGTLGVMAIRLLFGRGEYDSRAVAPGRGQAAIPAEAALQSA